MNDQTPRSVLQRMTHQPEVTETEVPLTASRAIRLAATRSAERRIGLHLSVPSVAEEVCDLDGLLADLDEGLLIHGLGQGDQTYGLLACNAGLCEAAIEVQTMGQLANTAPAPRRVTQADAAMIAPFLTGFLTELQETTTRAALDGWADDVTLSARLAGPRGAGFALADTHYRVIRLNIDLGVAERTAMILIALPAMEAAAPVRVAPQMSQADWDARFHAAVMAAPARLDAVLHRFNLPLSVATTLKEGQMIPLSGCTVGAVRLTAPDGKVIMRARLGQVAGQIAVRVEDGGTPVLRDLPRAAAAPAISDHALLEGDATVAVEGV